MAFESIFNRGRARGGLDLRVIIGLIIALFGFVSYFFKTQTNPVTGEKQRVALTVEQEISLGVNTAPQMASQMGGKVPLSDRRAQFVASVGEKIVNSSDARRGPYKFNFHLLADSKTVNAFALPGGQIFITLALLSKLENEAQLAGVLGHEIGHVIHRHSAEHMASAQLGQTLSTAVGVGASDDRGRGMAAGAIAQVANHMLQLKYGRSDEIEADTYGLKYMVQAGYDPRAMLGVMKVLQDATGGGGRRQPEFMVTHPYPENRVKVINEFLKKEYPDGNFGNLTLGQKLR